MPPFQRGPSGNTVICMAQTVLRATMTGVRTAVSLLRKSNVPVKQLRSGDVRRSWNRNYLSKGGPSSHCEMIILRNKSHGEIIRFVREYLRALVGVKNDSPILNKNTSPYFHCASLVIKPLTMLKRTHFSELSISRFITKEELLSCNFAR